MATAIKALRRIQIGVESTSGTAVAATRRLVTKAATYRRLEEMEEHLEEMHGLLARTVQAPDITREGTEFNIATDMSFEEILLALLSGVKGGVTPTTPGSGEARLWTFTPSLTASPAPNTYTLEFADRDGSGNEDGYESPYCFATGFSIDLGETGLPQLSIDMVGRKSSIASSTNSIALPTRSFAGNIRWAIYIDDSWANLGNTQITGQVYSGTFGWSDFLRPEYYHDGRTDNDFSQLEYNAGRIGNLVLNPVINSNSGLVPTERASKSAGSLRFVRIEITGAAFSSPDNGLNRFVRIDGAYYHAADSMTERGSDRNGSAASNAIHLQTANDPTQAQDIEFIVQNNIASYP